jgi:uncharacterized protein (DUF1778 family)
MFNFRDHTEVINEPKDARMEFRTKRHVKETIRMAAALSGVDDSAFAVSAAYHAALETIKAHERTVLAPEDRDAFFAALDHPPTPTKALRDAFALHQALVADDE